MFSEQKVAMLSRI